MNIQSKNITKYLILYVHYLYFLVALEVTSDSIIDEYIKTYLESLDDCVSKGSSEQGCDINCCQQNCVTFEFEKQDVVGVKEMKKIFLRMKMDITRYFSEKGGISIRDKLLLESKKRYNSKKVQFLDANQDGKLNKGGKSKN